MKGFPFNFFIKQTWKVTKETEDWNRREGEEKALLFLDEF